MTKNEQTPWQRSALIRAVQSGSQEEKRARLIKIGLLDSDGKPSDYETLETIPSDEESSVDSEPMKDRESAC